MANFIDVSNLTYCGKEANNIMAKQVYSLDLVNTGITFRDNVKGKEKLYTGELDGMLQEYTCGWTPSGEAVLAEFYIEPKRLKVNFEDCFDKFDATYFSTMTKMALDGQLPIPFAEWLWNQIEIKMKREYQDLWWNGDTTYSGSTHKYLKVIDGVIKKLQAEGATTITGSKITTANVIAQVEGVIEKGLAVADAQEVDTENYVVLMNYQDVRTLKTALGKLCCEVSTEKLFNNYTKEGDKIFINGFEVRPTMQAKDSIIFGPVANLVLGFDTADSQTEYRVIDMRETLGENSFRVLALTNIAAGIVFPDLFAISSL